MSARKIRIHDGIAGTLLLLGIFLGVYVDSWWLLIPAILGFLLIQSAFTGFCPVYFALNKIIKD